jgi:tetratricopeptide (TPR) repeat protein
MAKRAVRWAEAVDIEQTTRQWAAPAAPPPAAAPHSTQPASPSCAVCGGKPTEGAALPCCARPLCSGCGTPRRCPRCKAPTPTNDAAIAAALERNSRDVASAARRLGVAYARGELGLAQDERRAVTLYKAAAAAGDAAAQHNLGLMYMSGGKAPKALKWFRAAAAQDHAPSVYNLATAYAFGTGVPRDADEASALYRRAALLGSADAAYALGRLEPDAVAAREYFVVAARRGHRLAAAALLEG